MQRQQTSVSRAALQLAERHQEITETEEDEAGNRIPDRETPLDTRKTVQGGRKNSNTFLQDKEKRANQIPVR